jgi:hypothetical protein
MASDASVPVELRAVRKRPWPSIPAFLFRDRKPAKNLSKNSRCTDRDSKAALSEYMSIAVAVFTDLSSR